MSRRKLIVAWSAVALLTVLMVIAGGIFSLTQTSFGQDQVARALEKIYTKTASVKDALTEAQQASQGELDRFLRG